MTELELQEYIESHFDEFQSYISNYDDFTNELEQQQNNIYSNGDKILISDLIKFSAIKRLKVSFSMLNNLKLIAKEYPLLKTGKRGKQPSVDLIAHNDVNFCTALIELKINNVSEREAVSELSAYTQGLQNRFRGLSNLETLWIPISPEWRTTPKSAVEYILIWQNILVSPLKLYIQNNDLTSIKLECYNPINEITEIECLNLFSYDCFDAFDIYLQNEVNSKKGLKSYITSICSKLNINGFVIFHEAEEGMMYPYGFTLCIFNPYKAYLHKKLSLEFVKHSGEKKYYEALAKTASIVDFEYVDIDFLTDEIKEFYPKQKKVPDDVKIEDLNFFDLMPNGWNKDFLSIANFADNEVGININYVYNEIKDNLESNGYVTKALGCPDFNILFNQLTEDRVESVLPFGVHQELIFNRVKIEHRRKIHNNDIFDLTSSLSFYKQIFKEYNLK
ncbi:MULTISPECIES: hypothetical protein [Tenacibaculum]|uniref:hypothetical protein n=1 Tax=Tenacibaculum TaxID=104267 RepID=UPI00064A2355|nr:hypothetical protein [Tenacibaculum mesophilum]